MDDRSLPHSWLKVLVRQTAMTHPAFPQTDEFREHWEATQIRPAIDVCVSELTAGLDAGLGALLDGAYE